MIEWREGVPFSPRFGDVYFSATSGLAETEHVFLAGNRLAERFAKLAPGENFTLGETGFGTGLNFLAVWQLFERTAPASCFLDVFSVEKFPLSDEDLAHACAQWPELSREAALLVARWRRRVPGWNRWHFAGGRVRLTLALGDVAEALPELPDACIDAWFLDGFSPAKNPEMWSETVCRELFRATRPGGSFATYTCAGWVRRHLAAAGFVAQKARGFGRKREMLCGSRPGKPQAAGALPRRVAVIGAGLAGCAAAWALERRGVRVTVFDAGGLASGASGNPVGMLHLRLAAGMGALQRLLLAGFGHALAVLDETLPPDDDARSECGLLQLAVNPGEARRIARLAALDWPANVLLPVDAATASRLAGVDLGQGGLWFPQAGWVAPAAWCRRLTEALEVRMLTPVTGIEPDGGWRVHTPKDTLAVDALVVASGHAARGFAPLAHLPLQAVRGQITELLATAASRALRTVVCGEVYVTPAREGRHVLGATTRFDDAGTDLRAAEHGENLARLARDLPGLYRALGGERAAIVGGRAAVRCSAPGAVPILGEAATGLFVSLAHGTRGLITTPVAAELIASAMTGTLPPLPRSLCVAVSPARFGAGLSQVKHPG